MTAELEVIVIREAADLGYVAGFAVSERMIYLAGGTSSRSPMVLASSNARHFERRTTPRDLGLRAVVASGDAVWTCGEYGQLAQSRDHGATWELIETATDQCLFGLAVAGDGAVWCVGDGGYAARVHDRLERVELETAARLTAVYALGDEMVVLGHDGALRRWAAGKVTTVQLGPRPLAALAITAKHGTWIAVGDGGFIARSPDGAWWSRPASGIASDLEACATLADGRIVAVGARGCVLASTDDGRTWRTLATTLTGDLWAVERFGDGLLVGGDGGAVAKLAPAGDRTWEDRVDVFSGAKPLDLRLANGPDGFIVHELAAFLAAMEGDDPAPLAAPPVTDPAPAAIDEEQEGEDDDDEDDDEDEGGDPDDDAYDEDDDDDDDGESDDTDHEAFQTLGRPGTAESFAASYGVAMPPEVVAFHAAVHGREADPAASFHELRIDNQILPDVGDDNLFELLVRRDQQAAHGTGLVEAFCGVFCIGLGASGDTYHLELYEWDGPRQVLHHDRETRAFTGVVADSLDSLVYLASLFGARRTGRISDDAFALGLRKLRGRVAPTERFAIAEDAFTHLDPKRRDTEFFFYRAQWICALLQHPAELDDLSALFNADFNQVVPEDQLPARLDACARFIPTALYSMWRAFVFDEPELARYLEIGRRHDARLVRDAAALIDELRAGRNELGTIRDVRGWLAAFRALDLDPRRAGRRREIAAELDRTPPERWVELAWRWLGDGIAHRTLLERLDAMPATAEQLAALEGLHHLGAVDPTRPAATPPDGRDRGSVVRRVAAGLAPELEAVLVGCLVRGDDLAGALAPTDDGDESPGWAAIDRALEPVYHGKEPHGHYGTMLPYGLGGSDPIHGISVYLRTEPVPHFHFVTYGFTDLFAKETEDPEVSGFGFELTLRLARAADDDEVPSWAVDFLQNLGRYVFGTGNRFGLGHKMGLNGPIAAGRDTRISAIVFAEDPELGALRSRFGSARFLQIVGITDDEYRLIQEWSPGGLVELLRGRTPYLVTALDRASVLDDPARAAEIQRRVDVEGSTEEVASAGELGLEPAGDGLRITIGALYAPAIARAMRGRIRHGRAYMLHGTDAILRFRPGATARWLREDDATVLELPPGVAAELDARLRAGLAGEYRFETWPALRVAVTPSFIRDNAGRAVGLRGVADPDETRRRIDAENARLDASDDGDDDEDDADDAAPDLGRVRAALAMTERALALVPGDGDVQFTHAMLLLDANRIAELLARLPHLDAPVRINVAVRMGKRAHRRFGEAIDAVLSDVLPDTIVGDRAFSVGSASVESYGDVAEELFAELADAILEHAPDRLGRLVPALPADVSLLSQLAYKAIQADQREHALTLYDRVLVLPIPPEGEARANYLRVLNNACVQAHAVKAYDAAARIADRAQPVAHENPYIYHAAACAYAAVGEYAKALQQVKLAIEHDYDHVGKVEVDADLGPLLEWPEFKALFRDWHARQEGN